MLAESIMLARRIWGKRRSGLAAFTHLIAVGSVALSSAALLITLTVINGFERELQTKTALFIAHVDVRILREDMQQRLSWWIEQLRAKLDPAPAQVVAYAETEVLLTYRHHIEPAIIHIDTPIVHERIRALHLEPLLAAPKTSVAVGRPLAERLGVHVGDTLTIFAADSHRRLTSVGAFRARVAAIYESGMRQYDESVVYGLPELTSSIQGGSLLPIGLSIWLKHVQDSRRIAHQLDSLYGSTLYARTFTDKHPAMFAWIALQKRPIPIVVGILSIVAAFNILTLLFVSIVEKRNIIATLRLLGMQRNHLIILVAGYALWVGLVGYSIGLAIVLGFDSLQRRFGFIRLDADVYFLDRLPTDFMWWHGAIVGAVVIALTLMVTTIPAYASTRISPLSILRIK